MTVDELNRLLNAHGAPCFEAIANTGQGVFPTLKALAARVLETIHTGARPGAPSLAGAPAPLPAPTPAHAPAPAPAPAGTGTGYGARPLHQTGYTPVAPGAKAPGRPAVPVGAQSYAPQAQPQIPMQRGTIHSGTDTIPRSSLQMAQPPAGSAPAPIPMAPGAPGQIVRGNAPPPHAPAHAPAPILGGGIGRGAAPGYAPNLQMTPAARPAPAAPSRPVARPAAARAVQPRPVAPKVSASAPPKKKRSMTTAVLVVAALIAGAVMAFVVLS
jgi:hypothetical protein